MYSGTLKRRARVVWLLLVIVTVASAAGVDWGTRVSPVDWLSAIATGGAFAFTMLLLWSELNEADARRQVEEQADARLVSSWLEEVSELYDQGEAFVHVRNRGEEPVYEVRAFLPELDARSGGQFHVGFMARVVPPGADERVTIDATGADDELNGVILEFTDSTGRHWRRSANGGLSRIEVRDLTLCVNQENEREIF